MGGRIPNASAVRNTTELGCPARFAGSAFAICSSLYAARVFSVIESSSRSSTPRSSMTTFSSTVPKALVVADEMALRVGRQRRLPGARETEEHGHPTLVVDVGRAVHREHALERQAVVHHREDRLLDLARVVRAPDEHLGARRVETHERLR